MNYYTFKNRPYINGMRIWEDQVFNLFKRGGLGADTVDNPDDPSTGWIRVPDVVTLVGTDYAAVDADGPDGLIRFQLFDVEQNLSRNLAEKRRIDDLAAQLQALLVAKLNG